MAEGIGDEVGEQFGSLVGIAEGGAAGIAVGLLAEKIADAGKEAFKTADENRMLAASFTAVTGSATSAREAMESLSSAAATSYGSRDAYLQTERPFLATTTPTASLPEQTTWLTDQLGKISKLNGDDSKQQAKLAATLRPRSRMARSACRSSMN